MRTMRHRDIQTRGHRDRWAWEHRDIGAWGHRDMRTWGHRGVGKWDMRRTRDMETRGPESSTEQQQAAVKAEDGESRKRHKKCSE